LSFNCCKPIAFKEFSRASKNLIFFRSLLLFIKLYSFYLGYFFEVHLGCHLAWQQCLRINKFESTAGAGFGSWSSVVLIIPAFICGILAWHVSHASLHLPYPSAQKTPSPLSSPWPALRSPFSVLHFPRWLMAFRSPQMMPDSCCC